jgi:hypothetical protein
MTQIWSNYVTDTGYNYPFIPVSIKQISEINRDESPLLILPISDKQLAINLDSACAVPQLTPRKIKLYFSDDSIYEINYPRVFSRDLFNHLSASLSVRAFEFIGETIKYSRLIKMLNRG